MAGNLVTWAIKEHLGTRALKALTLGHLDTWALRVLRHLGTQALGRLLGTWVLGYSRYSGIWALEALYLADSSISNFRVIARFGEISVLFFIFRYILMIVFTSNKVYYFPQVNVLLLAVFLKFIFSQKGKTG